MAFLCFCTGESSANSAWPGITSVTQPDGTKLDINLRGDEHLHWEEDANSYTVIRHKGWYVYAEKAPNGGLVPSELRAGIDNPAAFGLKKQVKPNRSGRLFSQVDGSPAGGTSTPETAIASNVMKNLVVLIRFSNHTGRVLPTTGNLNVLMNSETPDANLAPTGSVKTFYRETSYGQFEFDSTVTYWIDLPGTEEYYANGDSGLTSRTHEALKEALGELDDDPDFNFTDFDQNADGVIDAITFVHSGYAAEFGGTDEDGANYVDRMWSHKWQFSTWTSSEGVKVSKYNINPSLWGTSGGKIGRIGVICHELGHYLGLPDLYDGSGGSGIGSWGLMANSWGFDGSQNYPPHMSAWSKIQLGWVTPTVISSPGNYTIAQSETNQEIFKINMGYPSGEYLLVENRQPVGYDAKIPNGGLAVFHIDDTASYVNEGYPGQPGWPENGNHYRVALLQADGLYQLEKGANRGNVGDLYRAGEVTEVGPDTVPNTDAYQGGAILYTGNRILNVSAPGSTMSFEFQNGSVPTAPAAPTNLAASASSYSTVALSWSDQSGNEDGFTIERSTDGVNFTPVVSTAANVTSYSDSGLSEQTTYSYRVTAFNAGGYSAYSDVAAATTPAAPAEIVRRASQENPVAGTVTGTYLDLQADDGVVEAIREVQSGGRKNSRYSYLDHHWTVPDVKGGQSVLLVMQAWASANSEGDDFQVEYSINGGSNWEYALTIPQGSPNDSIWTADLIVPSASPVLIRVLDMDSSSGNSALDTVYVDEMYIVTVLDPSDTPPLAPSGLSATFASGAVALSWVDNAVNELGYKIQRAPHQGEDYSLVGSVGPDNTSFEDTTVEPAKNYDYKVTAFTSSWDTDSDTTVTVEVPDGIQLTGSSSKRKGKVVANLSWVTGSSINSVSVLRSLNGGEFVPLIEELTNEFGGSYRDQTSLRSGTFRYKITGNGYESNVIEFTY